MIISRAPVRISLGGGGTDLPTYYSRFGGFLIYGAINKHVYVCANPRFAGAGGIRLSYSQTEIVDRPEQVQHRIFREVLQYLDIPSIELVSIADVPSNCGLGTSGAFTVALLNALHTFKRDSIGRAELAEQACYIEMERLGEPVGKQDQYAGAFGGINALHFDTDGKVRVEPVKLSDDEVLELERRLMLFYTGGARSASEILQVQSRKTAEDDERVCESLHAIREIGLRSLEALQKGDLDAVGHMFHEHWLYKKRLSDKISSTVVDEAYDVGRRNGALGGKLIGAGGGGFLMFYCGSDRRRLAEAMQAFGFPPMPFRFDFEGAKIVADLR